MIQQVIEAVCKEVQELFANTTTTVLRDTQFNQEQTPSHELPLVIVGIGDSPDMKQLSGGVTQGEWNWIFRVYFIDANAELTPDQAFSTGDYGLIETIVNHFNFQNWITTDFINAVSDYQFKMTFQDVNKAPDLMKNDGGIIPGYQISYSSIGIDKRTSFVVLSEQTLQTVEQLPMNNN